MIKNNDNFDSLSKSLIADVRAVMEGKKKACKCNNNCSCEKEEKGEKKADDENAEMKAEAYDEVAVNKAIKSSRKKIGGREAKKIHALLKGSQGYADRKEEADLEEAKMTYKKMLGQHCVYQGDKMLRSFPTELEAMNHIKKNQSEEPTKKTYSYNEEAENLDEISHKLRSSWLSKTFNNHFDHRMDDSDAASGWRIDPPIKGPMSASRLKIYGKALDKAQKQNMKDYDDRERAKREKYTPKVHDLRDMDHDEVYDHTQTSNKIKDGDVMRVKNGTAAMIGAWPTMIHGKSDVLHSFKPGTSIKTIDGGSYHKTSKLADLTHGIKEELEIVEARTIEDAIRTKSSFFDKVVQPKSAPFPDEAQIKKYPTDTLRQETRKWANRYNSTKSGDPTTHEKFKKVYVFHRNELKRRSQNEELEIVEAKAESPIKGTRLISKHQGKDGHHAEVRFNPDYNEYQVHHYNNGKHMGEGPVSYHGEGKEGREDATNTAEYEVKNYRPKNGSLHKEEVEVVDNEFNRANYKHLIGKRYSDEKVPSYARVKKVEEKPLVGNQHKLDKNKNGKLDAQDFKMLRKGKSIEEKLDPSMGSAKYIDDFVNSKDPRFEGKSKKERIKMALGAYYAAKNEAVEMEEFDQIDEKYGAKTNYKKHHISVNGKYVATTTWARSAKEAEQRFIQQHPEHKNERITVVKEQ